MPETTDKPDAETQAAIDARSDQTATAATAAQQPDNDRYITREAFEASQRAMMQTFRESMAEVVEGLRPRQPAAQERTIDYDAEIRKAEEEGDTGRAMELRIGKANAPLMRRINEVESFNVSSVERIASEIALRAEDRPIYERYRKEIDAVRQGFPNEARTNPEAFRAAIDIVRGRHFAELLEEDREVQRRKAAGREEEGGGSQPSKTVSSRAPKGDGIPAPEEVLNREQMQILEEVGGADQYAARASMGKIKTWNEYVQRDTVKKVLRIKPKAA